MAFNINEFRGEVNRQDGLSQPSRFRVLITGGVLKKGKAQALALLVNQAIIPGRNLATNEIRTHGPIRKMPYTSIYDDFSISVYCTNNGLFPRDLFANWQNSIIETTTGKVNYYDQYVSDINVEQYDEVGNIIYACKFIDAYPVIVAPLTLDWSATNTVQNLQVNFAYRWWQQDPLPTLPFGNNITINKLYPNVDLGGMLDKSGVAIVSRADGEVFDGATRAGQFFGNLA